MKRVILIVFLLVVFTFSFAGCIESNKGSVTTYDINASLDGYNLDIEEKIQYINNSGSSIDKLILVSYVGAYTADGDVANKSSSLAYPFGVNYATFNIRSIKIDNTDVKYRNIDEMYTELSLPGKLAPSKSIEIIISYSESLPKNRLRYGYNSTSINIGNAFIKVVPFDDGKQKMYPYTTIGDPFNEDVANYNVKFVADKKYKVVGSSKLNAKINGDEVIYEGSLHNVRDYAIVLSDALNVISDNHKGVNITYLAPSSIDSANIRVVKKCLDTFSKLYCTYPYDNITVVENDFVEGGMEYPCLVYVNKDLDAASLERTIVHEIAHQWWYGIIGVNENIDYFIDEGMAELSTYLYYIYNGEEKYGSALMKKCMDNYMLCNLKYDEENMNRELSALDDISYYKVAYLKAPLVLYNTMNSMGQKKFLDVMHKIMTKYQYKRMDSEEFLSMFGTHGKTIQGYIDGKILE